jgi:hypothetical protein
VNGLEVRLRQVLEECARLRTENAELGSLLSKHRLLPEVPPQIATPLAEPSPGMVTNASAPERKLGLFRNLFHGRDDVYAARWQKGEKSGYSPAAVMDWHAIHAAPPERRKEVARKTRTLQSLTDAAVRDHLEGKVVINVSRTPPVRRQNQIRSGPRSRIGGAQSGLPPGSPGLFEHCHPAQLILPHPACDKSAERT